jgi:beta-glucanase (GH16 family)
MCRDALIVLVIVSLVCRVAAGADPLPLSDPGNDGGWIVAPEWTDEFNGNALDRTKWRMAMPWWPAGSPPFYYNPANIRLGGGTLRVIIDAGPVPPAEAKMGYKLDTSAITHVRPVRFGLFETRAKIAHCAASSVFWFQHEMVGDKPDPNFLTEIDVVENRHCKGFEKLWTPTVHTFKAPGLKAPEEQSFPTHCETDLSEGFHVYAVEWGPQTIVFSIDGHPMHTVQNQHLHQPLTMTFNIECWPKWFSLLDKATLPATFEVDYVRAWKKPGE